MYANGTWCVGNPPWVQCPPRSHPKYSSGGTKAGEPFPLRQIKIVIESPRNIFRYESQIVGNSPLSNSSPMLNPTNQSKHLYITDIIVFRYRDFKCRTIPCAWRDAIHLFLKYD